MSSSSNINSTRVINDNDVIQSIYANRKEKFDILGLEPTLNDREQEIDYFEKLSGGSEEKKTNHEPISYYNTISTISKLGISQNVVFTRDELQEMCESKFGGGVVPVEGADTNNMFISRLPTEYNDESSKKFIADYELNKSFHSWLQNSKNRKLPDLLSHVLFKESNINIETLMLITDDELKNWSEKTNLDFTKNDTAELVDAFILYKKYVNLFK